MADKKISQLTAVTTPLTGAEEIPAVQSAVTKKVTVLELQTAPVSAGSANSVQYLNATKVPSTSTAFTFDGVSVSAPVSIVNSGFSGGRYEINFATAAADSRTWKIQTDYSAFGALSVVTAATQGGAVTKEILQFSASGNANLYLGNLILGTAGKGIDFSANTNAPGMTSELLTRYEEGAFTPVWNGGSVTVGLSKYTRIGRNVVWIFDITFGASVVVATSTLTIPFPCVDSWGVGSINFTDVGATLFVNLDGVNDTLGFRATANGGSISVATLATKRVVGMVVYNA